MMAFFFQIQSSHGHGKVELYFHRAAMLPQRPAFFGINVVHWRDILQSIDTFGPAVFRMMAEDIIQETVPDTVGKSISDIESMPPYVRAFRCGKDIEKGDPNCGAEKYTTLPNDDPCNNRKGKASWHPGW